MSGSQRVLKSSPCSSSKQGPMRATLPMSSLLRQDSSLRKSKSNSPTLSPTSPWKRMSPESMSGQRSPGSVNYKAKSKTLNSRSSYSFHGGTGIRRTASLDTIYLQGQWPRETFYLYGGQLLIDKATQTEEADVDSKRCVSETLRHRTQRVARETTSRGPTLLAGSPTSDNGDCLRQPTRSSTEGLNQEIQRLVLQESTNKELRVEEQCACTPEGHRAPPPELHHGCHTRSVNTQTPAGCDSVDLGNNRDEGGCLVEHGDSSPERLLRNVSPMSERWNAEERDGKHETSPRINKFLAREPPDGCERVSGKCLEELRQGLADVSKSSFCPLRACVTLTPSLGSAFYPLNVRPGIANKDEASSDATTPLSSPQPIT